MIDSVYSSNDAATAVTCSQDARHLFSAQGRMLVQHALPADGNTPEIIARTKAPGEIVALHCGSPKGPIVAVRPDDCAPGDPLPLSLFRLDGDALCEIARLPSTLRDIAETSAGIVALLGPSENAPARLLRLDRRSGAVLSVRTADQDAEQLRPATGTAVLTVARASRRVRRVDFDENCPPDGSPVSPPDRSPGDKPRPQRPGCACCDSDDDKDRDPEGRRPPRVPPRDHCDRGDDGVDDGCRFYTAFGAIIICVDRCRPDRDPCRRTLHAPVEHLFLVGGSLAAVTRNGRNLTLLDPLTLATQAERAAPGPNSFVLPAPAANAFVTVDRTIARFRVIQAAPATNATLDLQFEAEISERVFEGTDLTDNPIGPLFQIESKSVLVIPTVDPTQAYSGPQNGDSYKDALFNLLEPQGTAAAQEGPIAKVLRYYAEQSHQQQNIDFTVFGADTPQFYAGPPIEIEAAFESYFNGSFQPGAMISNVFPGESPAAVRFRGNETRNITAASSVGDTSGGANEYAFELSFPAALLRIALGGGLTVDINQAGPSWTIEYENSAGNNAFIVLDPSNLAQDVSVSFDAAGGTFDAELATLTEAVQTMIDATPEAGDFAPVEIVWGRRPNEGLGRLYVLFRFAAGGMVPRVTNPGTDSAIAAFFGIDANVLRFQIGAAVFDLSASQTAQDNAVREFSDYLVIVSRLAEIAATSDGIVTDPVLGAATVTLGSVGTSVLLGTRFELSDVHGQAPALIEAGSGSGADPLNLVAGQGVVGSDFAPDNSNSM
ncbi:MAG: hypothetical protein V2I76_15145, partial [Roseobacter sp.]|nr:hypothetical protein [Roseobacter sp.]